MAETGPRTANSSDNAAVAAIRDGIQLAVELLLLPEDTPIDPNPGLENRVVEVQGMLDDATKEMTRNSRSPTAVTTRCRLTGTASGPSSGRASGTWRMPWT